MNNIIGLIFSKDRAMQLQAGIESFHLHCSDADSVDMTVLYKASDQRHRCQYEILKRKFTSINFIEENNFRSQTLSQLNGYEYILFLVDDNMFIKPFTISQAINCLQKHGDAIGFSLRLGKNTTYCYALDVPQNLPTFQSLGEKAMKYNWTGQQSDFNYPLEVSSSIYKIADIMPLLTQIDFNNPNTLEGAMARNAKLYRELRPSLLCYEHSVAFCNPVNIVQQTAKNRYATVNSYTAEQLADMFAQGMSIDVAKYKDFIPNSIHQEVQLHFRKDALSEQQSGTFVGTVKDDMLSANTAPLPQFSIIMANYNNAKYISEAIESVLKQTFTNWQLIIVEDGSSDDSLAVINRYSGDSRIRLIRHEKNSGYTVALKTGIANLQTELFGILDSDDCLTPDAIETMYAHHIDKPDCGMIYSQFIKCREDMSVRTLGFCAPIPSGMTNVEMDVVSHFKTFKFSHYLKTAGYDEDIMYAEDKDISYRMEEVTKLFFVDRSLYCYRELPNSIGHADRTTVIGTMARGKAKINAFIRRKILPTKPILENPQMDAKTLLDQLKDNHPGDIAPFLDVLELAWRRQILDDLDLPAQSRSWPIETIIFWIVCNLNFKNIIDLIGHKVLDLCSERHKIIQFRQKLLADEQNRTLDSAGTTLENNKQGRSEPLFTIIIANYNNAKYIAEAINSVLVQTFVNWEIIIVDDGSTDNSLEVIDNYLHDKRIRLLGHNINKGYTVALKTGIAHVRSEYFGLLDSDDKLTSDAIEIMYAAHIEHPDSGLIYSQFIRCKEDMTPYGIGYSGKIPEGTSNVDLNKVSQFKTFKLSYYHKTAGYDENVVNADDKDISYRMEEVSKLTFIDKYLYLVRMLPESVSHSQKGVVLGEFSMGRAKINALIRRKILSTKPLLENPQVDAKPLLDKLKARHPRDIAILFDVIELAWQDQLLNSIDLPEQAKSWSTENIIFWIASTVNVSDIIDLIGNNILNLYSEIKQRHKSHKQLLKAGQKRSGTATTNIQTRTNSENLHTATNYFQKAQQVFANSDFQAASDYLTQYKAKMDYSLLPVTVKSTAERTTPDVSVVIVTYNRSKEVRELIGCLNRQDTSGFEVIVIDNSDGKDETVSAMADKYIDCPINFNLSEGRNIGAHFAKGHILVFLDDDALIDSNYIASIKQAFNEYDIFGLRGRAYPKTNADANDHVTIYNMGDAPFPTFCNQEGNSAFLRDVYMEMGGMDPLLFGHEGSDLTYRIIHKYGLTNKIIYWPDAIIYHDYGTGEKFAWKEQVHARSRNYVAAKHGQNIFELRQSINAEPMPQRKEPTNYSIQSSAACNAPRVSIIIACYNCAEYLPECMESINKQVFTEWELFLVDDASTDNTPDLIRQYAAGDKRIKPYYFSDNAGPYIRRNFAIERASSDFIVIQDADDIMLPTKLRRFYGEITAGPDTLGIVGSFFMKFLDEFKGRDYADMFVRPITHEEIMGRFQETWHFCWHASAIIRKELFTTLGLYDTQPYGSDSIWLAKAGLYAFETGNIRIKNIPEVLTYKRECLSSQTGTIPLHDPRGRRKKLEKYMKDKLQAIQKQYRENPSLDLAEMIRNCTFSDFILRFGHLFEQWESQPLTDQMIEEIVNKALPPFFVGQFVSCLAVLDTLECIAPDVFKKIKLLDLIRGLSYFALDMDDKSYVYMLREYKDHNSESAFEFIENYLNGKNETLSAADRQSIVKNTWYAAEMRNVTNQSFFPLLEKGMELLNASRPQEALVCFDQALKAGCNISCLHHARAGALLQLGRTDEARQAYKLQMIMAQNYIIAQYSQSAPDPHRSTNDKPMPLQNESLNYQTPSHVAHNAPKVSIVIACYNCQDYLPECVESINKQTLTDWELFLVDDASTDNTPDLIRKYAAGDKRIKPYYFSDNTGPYIRRNFAIERASADFIVIQDADDIMHPAKLRRFYDEITADPRLGIVGSFFSRFLDEFKGLDYADTNERLTTHEDIMDFFQKTWHICWHASAIIRKDLFRTIGLYDTQPYGSDTAWLAKAGLYALETGAIRIKNIPEVLTHKRECLSSQTGTISLHDPRGRRRKLEVYIIDKLEAIQKQYRQNPSLDIAEMIRNCTFSDYIPRFGHLFEQWETQPLNDEMIKEVLNKAFPRFTVEKFVSCLAIMNTLERIAPDIFKEIKTLDLIRGLSYFALDMEDKAYTYMSREYKDHNSETAFEFVENYLNGNSETLSAADRRRIVKNTWYSAEMRNVPDRSSIALLKKGIELLNASKPQEALACFDRAFNAGCNISCLHQARAATLMQLGRTEEANLAYQIQMTAGPSKNKTKPSGMSKENNLQVK